MLTAHDFDEYFVRLARYALKLMDGNAACTFDNAGVTTNMRERRDFEVVLSFSYDVAKRRKCSSPENQRSMRLHSR